MENLNQEGKDTAEFKAFVACASKLIGTIKGDLSIAEKLLEIGLISDETYEEVSSHSQLKFSKRTKAGKIFSTVKNKIKGDKICFNVFCDILNESPSYYADLYKVLKEEQHCQAKLLEATGKIKTQQKYGTKTLIVIVVSGFFLLLLNIFLQSTDSEIRVALKERYAKLDEIDFEQYLPESMDHEQIPFVLPRMRLVDEFQSNESDEFLSVNDLLESVEQDTGTRLAVIGRPGVGKSTLARYIAKLWVSGAVLKQIEMLIHICLGKANSSVNKLEHLLEEECTGLFIAEDFEFEVQSIANEIRVVKGKGIAFLLDGFDEYYPRKSDSKRDFIVNLLNRNHLPESTVLVTSRPRGIEKVKRDFEKRFQVVGFSQSDIQTSLRQLQSPLRSVIRKHFKHNPNVKKMCYLPLHMTMIIYLASLKEDALSEIDSETKIYTSFLHLTIEHYSDRHGLSSLSLDYCIEDLGANHTLCPLFFSVCELAFNATIHGSQTFSSKEIARASVTADSLEKLSLFNIKKESRRKGIVDVFAFSHPTFQEFMSAYFLSLKPKSEQHCMITRFGNHSFLQDLVWKFFFGLIGEKNELTSLFKTFIGSSGRYEQLPTNYYAIDLYPLSYAFETGKQNQEFADLLDNAGIVGPGNNYSLQIKVKEPMDLRSLLSIEETQSMNANCNFLFLTRTLEWISIIGLRIELQLQPASTSIDHLKVCSDYVFFTTQTVKEKRLQEVFDEMCSKVHTDTVNVTTVVLELEYYRPQKKVVNPQFVFSMLKSAILPDISYAQHLRMQMITYLDNKQNTLLRPGVVLKAMGVHVVRNIENIPSDLCEEELNFVQLWKYLERYSGRYGLHSHEYFFEFSELRKFKLKQLLHDIDFDNIFTALQSAKNLQILDLSHNLLYAPTALLNLLSSLKQLRILDLSDNNINLDFIAEGFKYLNGLHELNLSCNSQQVKKCLGHI